MSDENEQVVQATRFNPLSTGDAQVLSLKYLRQKKYQNFSYKDIAEKVREDIKSRTGKEASTSAKSVAWYASHARKAGIKVLPRLKRKIKGK